MATSFLFSVAEAYATQCNDFSDHLFVFPNRRACTFFHKYITQISSDKTIVLPKVMTMPEFVEIVSDRIVCGRIEALFILYLAYKEILDSSGAHNITDFDLFRRWGETVLSDFNEVDMQDVDSKSLFKNVKDLKEIGSNFLSDEQLKVMNEFFGQAYDPATEATEFWKKFNDKENNPLHSKFRLLWQVLSSLYESFKGKLEEKGLATTGEAYRRAANQLEQKLPYNLKYRRLTMVGFNALTSTERRIFDALAAITDDNGEQITEFFWDATGPVISDDSSSAGRYVQFNMKRWPMPDWAIPYIAKSDVDRMPDDIRVIAVPSNTMQTKVVAEVLTEMSQRLEKSDFTDTKVAVVLADEQLLIPMLYSVPEEIGDVNLTMGYPLRLSAIATFVSLLRRLESGRRKTSNGIGYYYKDLNMLLSHPFSRVLFASAATKVKEWIARHHHYIVNIADVRGVCSDMAVLLRPLSDNAGAAETANWLDQILKTIIDAIGGSTELTVKNNVDVANIEVYRIYLKRLLEVVDEYGISMQWRTFLTLTERLLSAETVTFEGQPLKGLQIMGILETRLLDFERIIITSLNERVLPARKRARTFISDSLRKAYGLPPIGYSESLFSYYFYRMISRAKEVVLLYDSRASEGARSGDVSRYVLQLQYLYARDKIKMESRSFVMSKSELHPQPIGKNEDIRSLLASYYDLSEDGSNLSATALTKYASCQLKFYYENILKIRTDEESPDYIDPMTQGSVVHDVMQQIYLPSALQNIFLCCPQEITADVVKSRINDTKRIDDIIRRSINKRFFHLPEKDLDRPLRGSSAHIAKILRSQVLGILRFDLDQTPFLLYGVEMDGNVSLKMPDGRLVNMRYAIDRLDKPCSISATAIPDCLRIVDYKTGSVHNKAETMESVFSGDFKGKNLLQLWLYANIFDALPDKNFDKKAGRPVIDLFGGNSKLPNQSLILELYDVSNISKGVHVYPEVEGVVQADHVAMNQDFLLHLEEMLEELFDVDIPFLPPVDLTVCKYCPFKIVCWHPSTPEKDINTQN